MNLIAHLNKKIKFCGRKIVERHVKVLRNDAADGFSQLGCPEPHRLCLFTFDLL